MGLLDNMNVGKKIILLAVTLLIFLSAVAGFGIRSLKTITAELNMLYHTDVQALSQAKEVNIKFLLASRAMRNMTLFLGEKKDAQRIKNYQENYNAFMKSMWQDFKEIESRLVSDAGKNAIEATREALKNVEAQQREIIKRVSEGADFLTTLNGLIVTRPQEDKAEVHLDELVTLVDDQARKRSIATDALYTETLYLSLSIFGGALLIGLLCSILVKRSIADPLVGVADKAAKVASGDLNQDFQCIRSDEIGTLASALEQMVSNLRGRIAEAEQKNREAEAQSQKALEAMSEAQIAKDKAEEGQRAILGAAENVEQVVSRLSTAGEELSAQVEESSRSMDVQRDRIFASTTAMEEMNSTVLEVARNAGVASEGSERARQKARSGEEIVTQSIQSLGDVQTDMLDLKRNMEDLGSQAESIGMIMTVISDIADQTNLLALNAAIEAARAGDAGRGFAVVADEVRKLAEKTMTATKEVGSAISGIQTGTRQSINAVERTTGNLDTASNLAKKSGEALGEIVEESIQTADQVRNIATAAEEQSATSEEITSSLDDINRMTGETAAAMQQSATAVSELASQAQELQRLVLELRKM